MIQIQKLNKEFEGKTLFHEFDLEIPDGSFVIINGNSGCGKTTLLNMIGGIEQPDSGAILVNGIDITKIRNKKKYFRDIVGFLFQNFALLENRSVRQNLELVQKSGRSGITVEEALSRVNMSGTEKKKVYQLSGGEQQRIALARLMYKRCELILADEPTGSLDAENGKIVMDILHELNRMGKTVIVVTHNQNLVREEKFVVRI